ncbi:MAG: hypothetical protein MZV63_58915 [Marinilabiliales bacterium]|nr:hypothetical protein [Marinilabiliales bacterium]
MLDPPAGQLRHDSGSQDGPGRSGGGHGRQRDRADGDEGHEDQGLGHGWDGIADVHRPRDDTVIHQLEEFENGRLRGEAPDAQRVEHVGDKARSRQPGPGSGR